MDVFILRMEGQGDVDMRVVDRETWEWIFGPSGRPGTAGTWVDPFVPAAQLKRRQEWQAENSEFADGPLRITSGSWTNDRALACYGLPAYDDVSGYGDDTEAEIRQRAVRLGDTVVDVWEGCIY